MGINLTFACPKHKLYHTPLRGQEGAAFQALVRVHKECFEIGIIEAWHDGYFIRDDWDDFFPDFDYKDSTSDYYTKVIEDDFSRSSHNH